MQSDGNNQFRLLVVDDIDDNRTLLNRRFTKRGCLVVEADNGFSALELIEQQEFDLVLLDITMPGMNGIEVLKRIRSRHSPDDLPVIMVTAKAGNTDVVEALEAGANDYVTKPIDFSIANARAQTQLARKRGKQALDLSLQELETVNKRLKLEIDERKQSDSLANHLKYHDRLTSLGNRFKFGTQLLRELQMLSRSSGSLAVMLFDLDGFKLINTTLGNSIGDHLLTSVAERLRDRTRKFDVIGRMGSDEFGVIAAVADMTQADQLAERIAAGIAEPYSIEGHRITLTASAGIALAPNDGIEPDFLIRNAQLALGRARSGGSAMRCFFEAEMNAKAHARRQLEIDLRKALSAGGFEVFYQPLFHLAGGVVNGCEALVRWRHPERGMVLPAEFISLAEETGLIVPLGSWVLHQACIEAASWPNELKVAVNVSTIQLRNRGFLETVMAALARSGLPANRLELEVTESVLLNEVGQTRELLDQLRRMGIGISLDDFGTGYASLSYLRAFPFDKIKLDRSFVQEINSNRNTMVMLSALINMADGLEMSTTAEGVETQTQLDWLKSAGCSQAQGYLISRPLAASDFRSFVSQRNQMLWVA